MGTVVWDTDASLATPSTFAGYEKFARESLPVPISHQQHHHHFHYPSGVYHTLGNLADSFRQPEQGETAFAHWNPDADVRESKIAYHIEMEVPGVSERKSLKIVMLSPRTLQVDGVAARPGLVRGREGDGELVDKSEGQLNGDVKMAQVNGDDAQDGGPVTKCVDTRDAGSEMVTRILHGERKIGAWRRSFTLPLGCDMATLRARLDSGLLHISVFKKEDFLSEEAKEIEVE